MSKSLTNGGPMTASNMPKSIRFGRRFSKKDKEAPDYHEKSKAQFAKMHQKKESRREMLEKERKGRRQAQVTLLRSYRTGDLPDIQMKFEDIIKPLRTLCYRDSVFARHLLTALVQAIRKEAAAAGGQDDHHLVEVNRFLAKAVNSLNFSNKYLAAAVIDLCDNSLDYIDTNKLVTLSRTLNLETRSLILLEQKSCETNGATPAQRRKKNSEQKFASEDVLAMIDLYKSIGDHSSARGLYIQELEDASEAGIEAMTCESLGQMTKAKKLYENLAKSTGDKLWIESNLNVLEELSCWTDLEVAIKDNKNVNGDPKNLFDGSWREEFMLPKYLRAGLHLQVEAPDNDQKDDEKSFRNTIKDILNDKKSTAAKILVDQYPYVVSQFFLRLGNVVKADYWKQHALQKSLASWSARDEFNKLEITEILHGLQRLSLKSDLEKWNVSELARRISSDLQAADDLILDQRLLWTKAAKKDYDEVKTKCQSMYLSLCKVAMEDSRLYEVGLRMARLCGRVHDDDLDLQGQFQEYLSTCYMTKARSASEQSAKDRFSGLYRSFMQEFQVDAKSKLLANFCLTFSHMIREIPYDSIKPPIVFFCHLLGKDDKKAHFREFFAGKIIATPSDLCRYYEERAVDELLRLEDGFNPGDLFKLTKTIYNVWNEFPSKRVLDVALILLSSHVKAMKAGSKAAMQLFPNLLTILEESMIDESVFVNSFIEEVKSVPSWMFLPWSNQIMALVNTPKVVEAIEPIVMALSEDYPQALQFAFNFVKDAKKQDFNKGLIQKLGSNLRPTGLTLQILEGLAKVSLPSIRTRDFVDLITKADVTKDTVDRLWADYQENTLQSKENGVKNFWRKMDSLPAMLKKLIGLRPGSQEALSLGKQIKDKASTFTRNPNVLSDYSSFLSEFQKSDHVEAVEMFGQYSKANFVEPDAGSIVKIASFGMSVRVFTSLQKPIKITVVGDNGKSYDFMIKCGEDLRQDERIQQAFRICNGFFDRPLVTYNVVPVNAKLGLIEFVPNTTTYKSLASEAGKPKTPKNQNHLIWRETSKDKQFTKALNERNSERIAKHRENVDEIGRDFLKKSFQKMSNSPEGFFYLRQNFAVSHAQVCLVGWLLSIGDRHADNHLVSLNTGECIAIDFGMSFGTAAFLPIPELVPFRFTPQIQSLLFPFKSQGPFKDTMIKCLQSVKANKEVLLAALSVFIKEPLLDWSKLNATDIKGHGIKKLKIVEDKLRNLHPLKLLEQELEHGGKLAKFPRIKAIIAGEDQDDIRQKCLEKEILNEDEIVSCLITLATDEAVLGRSYAGWNPWL